VCLSLSICFAISLLLLSRNAQTRTAELQSLRSALQRVDADRDTLQSELDATETAAAALSKERAAWQQQQQRSEAAVRTEAQRSAELTRALEQV
jgi:septal ring factor EnvC (AmiA/AmiB activator)